MGLTHTCPNKHETGSRTPKIYITFLYTCMMPEKLFHVFINIIQIPFWPLPRGGGISRITYAIGQGSLAIGHQYNTIYLFCRSSVI